MSTENPPPTPDQPVPENPGAHAPSSPNTGSSPTTPEAHASGSPAPAPAPEAPKPATLPTAPKGPPPQGAPRGGGQRHGGGGPGHGQGRGGDRPNRSDKPYNPGGAPPQLGLRDFGALKPNNRELDKLIEDELNQAMSGFDVETDLAQAESVQKPQAPGTTPGSRKVGVVIGVHGKDVFVEVPGGRSQGVLPIQQFEGRIPAVGESVEFDIDHYDAANGLLVLTREGSAQVVQDWSQVTYGLIVEARVTGTNKNKTGLMVEVNGLRGFLPASQLDMYRVENLDQFVNQRLKVMIAEVNPEERNLIVSRRAVLEKERQQKAEQVWATLEEGKV